MRQQNEAKQMKKEIKDDNKDDTLESALEGQRRNKNNKLIISLTLAMLFWKKVPANSLLKLSVLLGAGTTYYFGSMAYGYYFHLKDKGKELGLSTSELAKRTFGFF